MRWKLKPHLKPKRRYEEDAIHIAIVYQLRREFPSLLFTHPANGGHRDKAQAAKFKAMGQRAGVPDLIFWWPEKVSHGDFLSHTGKMACGFIELKAKKGRLTPEQKNFRDQVLAMGGNWELCRDYEQVKCTLLKWGVNGN